MDSKKSEFENFTKEIGSEMNSKKHSWIIFLCLLALGFTWFFLVLPLSGILLILSGILLLPISVWLLTLNDDLDMKIIDSKKCPICNGRLSIYRDDDEFWIVSCPACKVQASTNYQGLHSGD